MEAKTISFPKGRGHLTHNNREFISKNVAPERISWNRIYKQETLEDAYEICFGQALREYNENQKRKDRRKENYLKEIENSGNKEKPFYENVVQIGKMTDTPVVDPEGNLTEDAKVAIEVLEQYAKTFQERNPNLYMFNCVMHLDEATPHLHIDYIPVAHGYKTGLETRNSLTKALQQMGFPKAVSKKKNETVAWQERERAYLTDLCNERGIEIEMLGVKRDNLSLPEYKEVMRVVDALQEKVAELQVLENQAEEQLGKTELKLSAKKAVEKEVKAATSKVASEAITVKGILDKTEYVKVPKKVWDKMLEAYAWAKGVDATQEKYVAEISRLKSKVEETKKELGRCKQFMEEKGLVQAFKEFITPKSMKRKMEEYQGKVKMREKEQRNDIIKKKREKMQIEI